MDFLAPFIPWLVAVSALSVLIGAVLVPVMILRIPSDYFLPERRVKLASQSRHPAMRFFVLAAKILLGALLVVTGLCLLLLPGQGLLTLFAGLVLMDYPGKFRFERWIVRRPYVLAALNWLRVQRGRRPLRAP